MSEDGPRPPSSSLRTWLRRLLLSLAALLLLLTAAILAIPALASSDWARAKVEAILSEAAGRPASLRLLSLGWSDGLRLEGLLVGQGGIRDASFLCSLERLHLKFGLLSALGRDLRADLAVSGLRLRHRLEPAAKEPEAPSPQAKPLPAALQDALTALRQGLKPGPRKADAHIRVDLSDIAVRLDLPAANSTLDLRDAALLLDAPGLDAGPIRLNAGLRAFLNDKELAPLRLEALLEGLVDKAGLLAPAQAVLTARAEGPGLEFTAKGSVDKGFKADLRVDLRPVSQPLRPILGSALPEISGAAALGLNLSQPGPDRLALGLEAAVDALRASGGPLKGKSFGPLTLSLRQDAAFDLKAGAVSLPGSLGLLSKSAMRWQGGVAGLKEGRPSLTLAVRPLHLQLDELFGLVRAWLPPGLSMGAAALDAEGIHLKATLPEKAGQKPHLEASVAGLVLDARAIARASGPERLSLAQARITLGSALAVLPGGAPGRLELNAAVDLDGLRLTGKSALTVRRITFPLLAAKVEGFAQNPAALFGVSGSAKADVAGEVQGIEAPGKAQIPKLTQSLALRAELPAARSAAASLDSFGLDIPLLRVLQPGNRTVETPLVLRLAAPDIRLDGPAPLTASVTDARLDLDLGQALRCAATASLGGNDVRSSGGLTLDARRLFALAAPLLPRQAKASGGMALDWKVSAALPQQQGQSPKQEKLSLTIKRLGFLKELEAVLKLADISLDWPLPGGGGEPGETLRLRGLTTPRPLRLAASGGLRESSLTGSLAFGPLFELPGAGPLSRPLRGLLTVNAAQQEARSAQLSQVLHLDGLDLDQNLRLTLDRLDRVLDRDQDRLAAVLEHVDGALGFDLRAGLQSLPAKGDTGLSGKGRVEAGFDARLSGGRFLALSARLLSPGLDLRLGPELAVSGLTSSLRLDKRFALGPGLRCATPGQETAHFLSDQVFDQLPASVSDASGFASAVLHEFQPRGGALGLGLIQLKSGALPLDLRDVQLRLDTTGPLPALRSFRAGLLGGNLLGSARVRGGRGAYSLEADCAFTGIDPGRLLPDRAVRDLGDQAEAAGRVTLSVPLTADPELLLRRMSLRADITKVGPRTLERMLYALDPNEQNESIVAQRRLMGMGHPRHVRLGMAYGNLSLSGEVEIKGFRLELPRIDRLPVANLPIRRQLAKALAPVPALVNTLDAASADGICRDPAGPPGALKAVQNTAIQGGPR